MTVNSPGGSPVQSDLIHRRIKALSEQKKLPVYVFVEEMAASAGYHIAAAGKEVYAHEQSLVGSIGVVTMQFGVAKLLETIGVEPRIMHKGENKVRNEFYGVQLLCAYPLACLFPQRQCSLRSRLKIPNMSRSWISS